MEEEKKDLKSMSKEELASFIEEAGEPKFRAKQLYHWMHQKMAKSLDEMGNLPAALKEKIARGGELAAISIEDVQESEKDGTRKYLFRLADGNLIESVLMRYKFGNTACISSQAGCRMGCKFCASAIGGFARNLSPAEMLEQIYRIQRDTGLRVSRVVVMGTGEPLDNYDNLLRFLSILCDPDGPGISQRNVTVSTCGIAPNIRRLADEGLQITLALSLHAASQKKRQELMPVAAKYGIGEVLNACGYYFEQTGRRITFEYGLAAGVNDSEEDALALADLIFGMNCHVNLIPINPVAERDLTGSGQEGALAFQEALRQKNIRVTIRREMGRDIDAACGQLRKRHLKGEAEK